MENNQNVATREQYNQNNQNQNQAQNQAPQQQANSGSNTPTQTMQLTKGMKDRAESAKAYIETKYQKLKKFETNRKQAWDILQQKMQKLNLSEAEQELIKQDILHKEAELNRKMRKKISTRDFEPLSIIGRGAFGEVRICRHIETGEVMAVKRMKKAEMINKNQVNHIKAEREVLVKARNIWIVDLKFSFQDDKYLYLVMDFLPGGDLMTLLMRKDILTEEESRFYIAQTILSIESVHKVNFIHRDLKPDNILIDKDGHIKLTDFGLCKHAEIRPSRMTEINTKDLSFNFNQLKSALDKKLGYKRTRQLAFSTVGTPDYIAPEVFGQYGYDETVDWWSVGCILFEMLVGYPPFFSDEPSITCQKIMHWKKTFSIPAEAKLSPASTDILKRLICDADQRLGRNGADEIKAHPFFKSLDWDSLREMTPPYIPQIVSDISNENFDQFEEEDPFHRPLEAKRKNGNRKVDMNFVGYTYKADVEAEKSMLVNVLKELDSANDQQFDQQPLMMQSVSDEYTLSQQAYGNYDQNHQNDSPKQQNFLKHTEESQRILQTHERSMGHLNTSDDEGQSFTMNNVPPSSQMKQFQNQQPLSIKNRTSAAQSTYQNESNEINQNIAASAPRSQQQNNFVYAGQNQIQQNIGYQQQMVVNQMGPSSGGNGNRQPIKQFKPSPRVGINNQQQNYPTHQPQTLGRPGTAGGISSSNSQGRGTANIKNVSGGGYNQVGNIQNKGFLVQNQGQNNSLNRQQVQPTNPGIKKIATNK